MYKKLKNQILIWLHGKNRHYDLFGKKIPQPYSTVCFVCNKKFEASLGETK